MSKDPQRPEVTGVASLMLCSAMMRRLVSKGVFDQTDIQAVIKMAHDGLEDEAKSTGADAREILALLESLATKAL